MAQKFYLRLLVLQHDDGQIEPQHQFVRMDNTGKENASTLVIQDESLTLAVLGEKPAPNIIAAKLVDITGFVKALTHYEQHISRYEQIN
jgi:hypothetical protein